MSFSICKSFLSYFQKSSSSFSYVFTVEDAFETLDLGFKLPIDLVNVFDLSHVALEVPDQVFSLTGQFVTRLSQVLELTLCLLVRLGHFLELLVQTSLLFKSLFQFTTFLSCLLCELSNFEGEFVFFFFKTFLDFFVVLFRLQFL